MILMSLSKTHTYDGGIEKMTVREFVEEYKKQNEEHIEEHKKYKLVEAHIIKTYLPYIQKVALAKTLNDATMYKWIESTDVDGNPTKMKTDQVKISSHIRNLLFKRMVIENYTDLEIEDRSFYNEYDLLKECGAMKMFLYVVREDLKELEFVCDMIKNDTIKNEYEINAQIAKIAEAFSDKLDPVFEALASKIQSAEAAEIIQALGVVTNTNN